MIRFRAIDDGVFVGYAMPRRLGPAVVRNRLRRQLRAVFEMMARDDDLRLRDGLYLVRAENAAVGSDLTVLRDEVSGLLDELHQVRAR